MSKLQEQFASAADRAQQLPRRPDNDTLLKLYALYKQSTVGDVNTSRPGFTDPVGRAKYDAWSKLKGTAKQSAMKAYIDLVDGLAAGVRR